MLETTENHGWVDFWTRILGSYFEKIISARSESLFKCHFTVEVVMKADHHQ